MKLPIAVAAAASAAAIRHGLDACLLAGIVQQESGGNTWAWNPEPRYGYLWNVREGKPFRKLTANESMSEAPPADFPTLGGDRDQEWWGQQASWGAAQVMGGVAREHGFRGLYLPELCNPDVGLEYAARHLAAFISRWDVSDAVSAYNAGHPTDTNYQKYTSPVLQWTERFRREGF